MRRAVVLGCRALALTLTLGLAGCGDEDRRRGPAPSATPRGITVAAGTLPTSLDPALAVSPVARAVAVAVQTPLLTYRRRADADAGQLVAALAERLPELSADDTEYRFTLRPGLLYADGRLVKASDVERAIAHASRVAADPALRSALRGIIGAPSRDGQTLSGVRTDDRTGAIVVRLRRPDGRIPLALAEPATAPMPELPSEDAGALPASTGPLRIARRTATALELVANPLRARINAVPASATAQISVTDARPSDASTAGAADPDLDLVADRSASGALRSDGPSGTVWSLVLAPRGAFVDRAVRRELAAAVDRRALDGAASAGGSGLVPACGLMPLYVVGAVVRDDCPPAPVAPARESLTGTAIRLAFAAPGPPEEVTASLARRAIEALGGRVQPVITADPLRALARGDADTALVRTEPGLPHPAAWLTPAATVDALLAREVPRELAGPLTGSSGAWSSLERRAVDRAIAVPLAAGRQTVWAAPTIDRGSILLHPVLGLTLTALRLR